MPNEDDRLVMMMFQDEADGVCRTGKQVLQRITLGKPDKLRRKMPKSEKSWRMAPDLFESVPLPRTIIEIDETREHLARRSRPRNRSGEMPSTWPCLVSRIFGILVLSYCVPNSDKSGSRWGVG